MKYYKVTFKNLAMEMNISAGYLCDCVNGKKEPSLDTMKRIKEVTNGEVMPNDWIN